MKRLPDIWRENRIYFILYAIMLFVGMSVVLMTNKGDVILWLNARHTPSLDLFFRFWTKMGEEWPFIIAGIVLIFYRVRHALYVLLLGASVTIVSFMLKHFFAHPRPAKFFEDQGLYQDLNKVEFIQVAQGFTSFPSGHTMAAFAIFTFLSMYTRSSALKILFLLSAVLVAVSRIYLLQHFLQDVCLGSLCGIAIALIVYRIQLHYIAADRTGKWNLPIQEFVRERQN